MYKYFVSFNWTTRYGVCDDCTIMELDHKVDSEETLEALRKDLGQWKTGKNDGFYVVITTLTLLS